MKYNDSFVQEKGYYSELKQLQAYQATKPHYESLGEGGRHEDEEGGVNLQEPIWIHVEAIDYKSHPSWEEIVGEI